MMKRLFLIFLSTGFIWGTGLWSPLPTAQPEETTAETGGQGEETAPAPRGIHSFEQFKKLPVLEEGRIKPLETYAENLLLRLSGRHSYEKQSAVEWLARLLFAPDTTRDDKIFLINHHDVPVAMGVEPDKKRRYSFNQLEHGYPKLEEMATAIAQMEPRNRSLAESEILRLSENLKLFAELSRTFVFAFPDPDFSVMQPVLRKRLDLPMGQHYFTYLDIALRADKIYEMTRDLEKKPATEWSEKEKELVQVMTSLYHWPMIYHHLPFQIIPGFEPGSEQWLSPWDTIGENLQVPQARDELSQLQEMMVAYWNGEQLAFDSAVVRFTQDIRLRLVKENPRALATIPLELVYYQLKPFLWAKIFYGFTFLLFLCAFQSQRIIFRRTAWALMLAGFLTHVVGLVMRICILGRPPVSTLYETFIFVGFVAVLLGLTIEKINRQWVGIVVASLSGFIFLTIAGKFSMEGDTMQMLVAVLNSNFWLSTHVLSITTGYGGCCVAGVVGHIYLLESVLRPNDTQRLKKVSDILTGTLAFGLTMTFLGTNLGGIWADQSWGRFWGWDPKENGALLIVLWTAAIFHARVGRLIGPRGTAVAAVLGMIVVMWAWFGVNLLSVGLHSYGFTSGTLYGLIAYVLGEFLFLGVTRMLLQQRANAI